MRTKIPADPERELRAHGLSVTAQRLAVLQVVTEVPHCSAEDVERTVRASIGTISHQGVYDALSVFAERGILRRIQPAGSSARYESRVGDNHHHVICRSCDRMVDVDCAVGERPCLLASNDQGFEIDEAEVIYWGTCPQCVDAREGQRT